MYIFLLILSGIFGAVVGSFLNVVIYRLGTGTISKGRSICLSCGNKLRVRDLFPIISFLMLRGKCSNCKSKISSQYITVETIMMFISILIFMQLNLAYSLLYIFSNVIFYTTAFAILIVIFFYDLKHKIIPDELSFIFAAISFAAMFFTIDGIAFPGIFEILAGPALAFIPALIFFLSKGEWMGLGDAKLFLGVGWFLGFVLGWSAFVLSFWLGSIIAVFLIYKNKKYNLQSEIPFAPYIVAATFIIFFTKIDIIGLSTLLTLAK